MVVSSVGSSDPSGYYGGISTGGSSTNALSGSGLPTQDSINLQLDSSLLQSLSQPGTPVNVSSEYPTNIQQEVQDLQILSSDTNLSQMLSQQAEPSLALPTNIQQAVQDQTILDTNSNLAQTLSQQAASPLLEPLEAALETLPAAGTVSTESEPPLTSLAASMQVLQNLTSAGTIAGNPSLAQSILQNYTTLTNLPSPGSLVDTNA